MGRTVAYEKYSFLQESDKLSEAEKEYCRRMASEMQAASRRVNMDAH